MTQAADGSTLPANPAEPAIADQSAAAAAAGASDTNPPAGDAQPAKTEHELEVERLRRENAKLARRIDRRTHALGERDRELAMLRSGQPARQPAPQDDDDEDALPAPSRARQAPAVDPEERARELAAEMRRGEKIATSARAMLEAGTKLDKEFRNVVNDLAADLPMIDQRTGRATEFAEQVLECDNPAAVLLHIAQNDDIAQSLQGLTGAALGRRLAKLETAVAAAKREPTSNAPRPLDPLRPNAGAANEPRDSDTADEWRRKEAARLNAKRLADRGHAAQSR